MIVESEVASDKAEAAKRDLSLVASRCLEGASKLCSLRNCGQNAVNDDTSTLSCFFKARQFKTPFMQGLHMFCNARILRSQSE
jgi:hypothetical protein